MKTQKLLLAGDYPVIASPLIAKTFGMASATFLQKLHYCLQSTDVKTNMGKKYWFHTYTDWVKTIGMYSVATIKRVVKKLTDEGVIIIKKLSAGKWIQTNYYTINYQQLESLFTPQATPVAKEEKKITIAKAPKAMVKPITVAEVILKGTLQPTTKAATDIELLALPDDKKSLYKALRQLKVDVEYTDVRLDQLVKISNHVVCLITNLKRDGINKYEWHTLEQLHLDNLIK